MKVNAVVSSVRELPLREGNTKRLKSVSLEGLSCLVSSEAMQLPDVGFLVNAVVDVRWKEGGAPTFWLKAWERAPIFG